MGAAYEVPLNSLSSSCGQDTRTPGALIVTLSPACEKGAAFPLLSIAPTTINGKSGPAQRAGTMSTKDLSGSLAPFPAGSCQKH